MRHRKSGNRLKRSSDHRHALLRNLSTSLVLEGRLKTTTAKAKALKAFFEPIMSKVKEYDDLRAIRYLDAYMYSGKASRAFLQVARETKKASGWLVLSKIGTRRGDAADMTLVELL